MRARSSSTPRDERPPSLVGLEQAVEGLRRALAGERRPHGGGIRACCPEVDHADESRTASITVATPCVGRAGAGRVGDRQQTRVRALDGDAEAGRVEELDVVLAVAERDHAVEVEAEQSRPRTRVPDPFVTLGLPISSMYGSDVVRNTRPSSRRSSTRADLGEDGRLRDGDELRRRPVEPREQVADLDDRQMLEHRVARASTRSPRRRRAGRRRRRSARCRRAGERRDRLPRDLELERLVEEELAASAGRRRPPPGSRRPARGARRRRGSARPSGTSGPSRRGRERRAPATRAIAARVRSPDDAVRPDQRAVEVAGERLRPAAAKCREVAQPPADEETNCATSAICCGSSWSLKDGIPPWPSVTRWTTSSYEGFASSRFGPTVPVAFGCGQRVARDAAGALEDLLARRRVALQRRAQAGPRFAPGRRLLGQGADDRLGRRR